MANWCFNSVEFQGDETVKKKIEEFFKALAIKEMKTMQGQLPEFVIADSGYLHEIDFEAGTLYYQTKGGPNTKIIKEIADYFNCDFYYTYDEPGNYIYGNAVYKNKVLKMQSLEETDFEFLDDGHKDVYLFENQEYDNEYDILNILLERKEEIILSEI